MGELKPESEVAQPVVTETPELVELSARYFAANIELFKSKVNDLSMKSAKRLLIALVEFPLHDEKKMLISHKSEVELFEVALELMESKAIMLEYSVKQKESKNG